MNDNLTRKIDFRLSDREYRILRLVALQKDVSVSQFARQMVGACLAPTAVALTDDMIDKMEKDPTINKGRLLK